MNDSFDATALVGALAGVQTSAAAVAGETPLGVRAVEPVDGRRAYLCAFAGPRFLCLDGDGAPETRARSVREVASAALLCERALDEIAIDALHALASTAGRLLPRPDLPDDLPETLHALSGAALRLAAWAAAPERAVSSVPDIDEAIRRHETLRRSYGAFVTATDPLVERQAELPEELVLALREIEERSGGAGLGATLASRLGGWITDCDEGAADVVAAHITPLNTD